MGGRLSRQSKKVQCKIVVVVFGEHDSCIEEMKIAISKNLPIIVVKGTPLCDYMIRKMKRPHWKPQAPIVHKEFGGHYGGMHKKEPKKVEEKESKKSSQNVSKIASPPIDKTGDPKGLEIIPGDDEEDGVYNERVVPQDQHSHAHFDEGPSPYEDHEEIGQLLKNGKFYAFRSDKADDFQAFLHFFLTITPYGHKQDVEKQLEDFLEMNPRPSSRASRGGSRGSKHRSISKKKIPS